MAEQNGSLTLDERRQLAPGTWVRYQREFDTHEILGRVQQSYPSGGVLLVGGAVIVSSSFLALTDPPPCAEPHQKPQDAPKAEPPAETRTKLETRSSVAPARAGKPRGPTQAQLDARRAAVREYDRVLAEGMGIDAALTAVNREAAACGLSKGRWTVQLISWHRRSLKMPAATQGPKSKPKPRPKVEKAASVPVAHGIGSKDAGYDSLFDKARARLAHIESEARELRSALEQAEAARESLLQIMVPA